MYKRKARILFVSGHAVGASMAQAWANLRGADWLEARAVCLDPQPPHPLALTVMHEVGAQLSSAPSAFFNADALAWADLVVTLCRDSAARAHALPPGVQKKYWPVPEPRLARPEAEIGAALRVLRDELRERVDGLIGGMRLLARMDAGEHDD